VEAGESDVAEEKVRRVAMPDLKLLVWNVEWMNDLFVADAESAAFKPDDAIILQDFCVRRSHSSDSFSPSSWIMVAARSLRSCRFLGLALSMASLTSTSSL
jgi:hypothetical protein